MHPIAEIKTEAPDTYFPGPPPFKPEEGTSSSELAPPMDDHPEETKAPAWFPSSKGRSIVWDHITWVSQSQRAACNYCPAEFQIKGGTSALLRHLKTIHPAAINFDPENPPPIVRRKKRKIEDYTIVTEDTKSYMDNLLEQFLQDDSAPRVEQSPPTGPPQLPPPDHQQLQETQQSRADSEIDEVIRSLQKESAAQTSSEHEPPDQDLRKLLGMGDEQEVIAISGGVEQTLHNDEEKQVSSSSSSSRRRKTDEATQRPMDFPGLNGGKLPLLSSIRRPPPASSTSSSSFCQLSTVPLAPPPLIPPGGLVVPGGIPGMPAKYNTQAVQILDFEAKVLYNQSMHAMIAREDAMTTYYRMKARKVELEIKKLERELGEDQDDHQEE